MVTGFLERLAEQRYQYCVIDPEGDYEGIATGASEAAIGLGAPKRAPTIEEVTSALSAPDRNVVVNLLGLPMDERPRFCAVLLPRLRRDAGALRAPALDRDRRSAPRAAARLAGDRRSGARTSSSGCCW